MTRYVDTLPTPAHVEPKKLVVLSAPRSGTHSLYNALKLLGFKPFHMEEVLHGGLHHIKLLNGSIDGEWDYSKPYTREDFDKWFADYDVIIEMPFFALRSTIKAYPDAKFVLVEREADKWARSFANTIGKAAGSFQRFPLSALKYVSAIAAEMSAMGTRFLARVTRGADPASEEGLAVAAEYYREYIAEVKRLVPPEKLQVIRLEDGYGWEEVCAMVGAPVPADGELAWPDKNTPDQFGKISAGPMARVRRDGALNAAAVAALPLLAAGGLWWLRQAGRLPRLPLLG